LVVSVSLSTFDNVSVFKRFRLHGKFTVNTVSTRFYTTNNILRFLRAQVVVILKENLSIDAILRFLPQTPTARSATVELANLEIDRVFDGSASDSHTEMHILGRISLSFSTCPFSLKRDLHLRVQYVSIVCVERRLQFCRQNFRCRRGFEECWLVGWLFLSLSFSEILRAFRAVLKRLFHLRIEKEIFVLSMRASAHSNMAFRLFAPLFVQHCAFPFELLKSFREPTVDG